MALRGSARRAVWFAGAFLAGCALVSDSLLRVEEWWLEPGRLKVSVCDEWWAQ